MSHRKKQIGARTFHVGIIPARRALKTSRALAAILGPAIESIVKLGSIKNEEERKVRFVALLADRFGSVDDAALEQVVDDLASVTRVEGDGKALDLGTPAAFDAAFTGKLGDMMAWLIFSVQVNFPDFFSGLGDQG